MPVVVMTPLTEDMDTIFPRPERIAWRTAWVTATYVTTLTSTWREKSSMSSFDQPVHDDPSIGDHTIHPVVLMCSATGADPSACAGDQENWHNSSPRSWVVMRSECAVKFEFMSRTVAADARP